MVAVRHGLSTMNVDKLIENSPCSEIYLKLDKCLQDTDRNWRQCQNFVKELAECNKKNQKNDILDENNNNTK